MRHFCCPEMRIIVSKYDVKQEVTDKFSLRGRVFHKLREDILSGKYQEHEELKEVAIGEEMGVSRNPRQRGVPSAGAGGTDSDHPQQGSLCHRYYSEGCEGYLHDPFPAGRSVCPLGYGTYHQGADGRDGRECLSVQVPCPEGGIWSSWRS